MEEVLILEVGLTLGVEAVVSNVNIMHRGKAAGPFIVAASSEGVDVSEV